MDRTRRRFAIGLGIFSVAAISGALVLKPDVTPEAPAGAAADGTAGAAIRVVKSPYCGCCAKWVTYLEQHSWTVEVEEQVDLAPTRRQAGVPEAMAGCHTAFVDGYVVEGHVPVGAIEKLLAERPELDGISVPGMPADSPGMGGGGIQDVYGFKAGRSTGLYTRAQG